MKDENQKPEVQIAFDLGGFTYSPHDITKRLEITPDTAMFEGERNRKLNLPRANIWSIRSKVDGDPYDIDEHWDWLLRTFKGKEAILLEYSRQSDLLITVICYPRDHIPPLYAGKRELKFLADCGAELTFDIYLDFVEEEEKWERMIVVNRED